jgi:hypothetical protein
VPRAAVEPPRRYTGHTDPAAETVVDTQLRRVLEAIAGRVGRVQAVVLSGSFGRGEGGVFRDGAGALRPVNDYDVLVVDPRNLAEPLAGLGDALASELGLDFVDLSYSDGNWESLPPTLFYYDLKNGSRVIAGDPSVLDRIPAHTAADLPVYESVKLLLNRTAGLLSGLRGRFLAGEAPTAAEGRYLTNQIVKCLMAIGDSHLVRWQAYDSSYRTRRERFGWLARGAGLDAGLAAQVCRAYEFKCQPDYDTVGDWRAAVRELQPHLEARLLQAVNQLTEGHATRLPEAMTAYLAQLSGSAEQVRVENARSLQAPGLAGLLQPGCRPVVSLQHLVYSVLPALLAAAFRPERVVDRGHPVRLALESTFLLPPETGSATDDWEQLRSRVIQAWFAVCH